MKESEKAMTALSCCGCDSSFDSYDRGHVHLDSGRFLCPRCAGQSAPILGEVGQSLITMRKILIAEETIRYDHEGWPRLVTFDANAHRTSWIFIASSTI